MTHPPCPFCGGEPTSIVFYHRPKPLRPEVTGWYIECTQCGGRGGDRNTVDLAWAAWTKRAP